MNADELTQILEQHKLWLADKTQGKRADLFHADLRSANLCGAKLRGADLSGCDLRFASLRYADLRGCDLRFASLRHANLRGCDLRDANLSDANLSGCDLRGCDLRHASLRGCDLRGCDLRGCDLRGCDLRFASLRESDLSGAKLSCANLSRVDLSGTQFPTVTPYPQLVEKIAEQVDAHEGCLSMRRWHTCDTVHCLAGWAVTLHEDGKKLEDEIGTSAAAALIFHASCGEVPDFYSDEKTARAWLKLKVNQRGKK